VVFTCNLILIRVAASDQQQQTSDPTTPRRRSPRKHGNSQDLDLVPEAKRKTLIL